MSLPICFHECICCLSMLRGFWTRGMMQSDLCFNNSFSHLNLRDLWAEWLPSIRKNVLAFPWLSKGKQHASMSTVWVCKSLKRRVYWFCVTKCNEPLKSPRLAPGVLSGCVQSYTSEKPGGSSELHRARKDHPAFILTAHCPLGKKVKHEAVHWPTQQKQRQAHREPDVNSGTVPENFLGEKNLNHTSDD